jgi:hypothetical protein
VQYALTHHVAEDRAEYNATTSIRDRNSQNAGCAGGLNFLVLQTFALTIKERIGSVAVCVVTGLLVGFCDFTRSIADSV